MNKKLETTKMKMVFRGPIRSLFQVFAISIVPFGVSWEIEQIGCGSVFYLVNIVTAIATLKG